MTKTKCTVYLWLPGSAAKSMHSSNPLTQRTRHIKDTGHAAMQIGTEDNPALYVSWWPATPIAFSSWFPAVKHAGYAQDFATDNYALQTASSRSITGDEIRTASHKKVHRASEIIRFFKSERVSCSEIGNLFHEGMLDVALGIEQSELGLIFIDKYNSDEASFLNDMQKRAVKQVKWAKKALKQFGAKKRSIVNDKIPWEIEISGLDYEPMVAEWTAIKEKQDAHFRLFRKNCSSVVHRVLAAGGGDRLAGFGKIYFWTPSVVAAYCLKLQAATEALGMGDDLGGIAELFGDGGLGGRA